MNVIPVITGDLSHTLFVPELNEHYHSTFGAIRESKHIFIEAGLHFCFHKKTGSIRVLEIGFGTGLNALLACLESSKKNIKIYYETIEPFPLEPSVWEKLNYPELLSNPDATGIFSAIHTCPSGSKVPITDHFIVQKRNATLEEVIFDESGFDLVFFDAFGPEVQPELWTESIFRKIFNVMGPDSILITYSSKGLVRRALKAAGFHVEKLPGPEGKREITRALKTS